MRFLPATACALSTLVALLGAPARGAPLGPGPHDTAIPSTGQRLSIAITQPAEGGTLPLDPGTGELKAQCALGTVPPQTFNVLYVIDVSGSTDRAYMEAFGIPLVDVNGDGIPGGPGDDVNGDGQAGDTLDGELAGVLALNASLGDEATINVGVVAFASHAGTADVDPADGVQVSTGLRTDHDGDGTPDIEQVLRSVDSSYLNPAGGRIGLFTPVPPAVIGSQTNFAAALAAANTALAGFPAADRNLVFFLSDGRSTAGNRCVDGDCAVQLAAAAAAHTVVNTFGVGTAIDDGDLRFIATQTGGTFTAVPEPAHLSAVLPVVAPAGLDHAEVNGTPVALDALGRFTAPLTCTGRTPFTTTARCIATDPAHTVVAADVTIHCVGVCGDGVVDPGEECDHDDPCCSPTCRFAPESSRCPDDGNVCNGESACHTGVCGPATAADTLACGMAHQVAVISNFGDDTIALLDAKSGTVSAPVPVSDGPWGVAIHPRGGEVWVTNRKGNRVSVLDAATGAIVAEIPTSGLPLGIAFSPDGARAYVASYQDDRIDVLDTAARAVIAHVPTGRGPSGLAFDPTGRAIYVADYADDTVSVVDADTNTVVATVKVGHRPVQIAVDPIRGRAYVTDFGAGKLSVLGTVSRTVLRTLRVGPQPFSVAVDAARGRAVVTSAGKDSVMLLDAATAEVTGKVRVGKGPLGVAVDLSGMAWVANGSDDTLQPVDLATATAGTPLHVGTLPVAFGIFVGVVGADCPRTTPSCDDADPMTADVCTPDGGCQHQPLDGIDAARALLAALDGTIRTAQPGALGGPTSAQALADAVAVAQGDLTPTGPSRAKHASRQMGRMMAVLGAGFRTRGLDRDVGLRLLDLARAARTQLRALR